MAYDPRGARLESPVEIAPKAIYVFDTVSHVFTILQQAGEWRIATGAPLTGESLYGYVHFHDCAFLDSYVPKRSKDTILVLRRDRHSLCFQYTP